jgi:tRNA 2-thiocytidine biosynthesis protein TtcA
VTDTVTDTASAVKTELKIERENHKLEKRLCRLMGQAISDYNMIEAGDRVMVCMSGGKDSYALLDILRKMQARAPVAFELIAVNLDQKQPGFPADVLPNYLSQQGVQFHIETQDTYSIVYRVARELGCNKIALGHHRDDILQTFFLNMFFGGKLKGMPPKLASDNGEFLVIRPLAYVAEKDLIRWAQVQQYPIIPCTLCGSQDNLQRQLVGEMLRDWEKKHPGRIENMFAALQNVVPSHLMDHAKFDFKHLVATGVANEEGDKAFDHETFALPSLPDVQVVTLQSDH